MDLVGSVKEGIGLHLRDLVTRPTLRRLAGARSFERGVDYVASGRVSALVEQEESVVAKVSGGQQYEVRLWVDRSTLGHSCSCPMSASGAFCKHGVAVGLAYLAESSAGRRDAVEPVVTLDDVHTYLSHLDHEQLASMLLEQARLDDHLWQRLLARAARTAAKRIDPTPFFQAIDNAVWTDDFVDYRAMRDYSNGIQSVIGSLHELLGQDYADEVVTLTEHFVAAVEDQLGHVDDSDGHMGGILHSLQDLHHAACQRARPEPEDLARRLFGWEASGEHDVFSGAMQRYADVLGEPGLVLYRRLTEEEWKRVPLLGPGDKDSAYAGRRFRITQMMQTLAREEGDVDALVAIMSRDLSHSYDYLRIAETCRGAGQLDRAVQWAEEGLRAFSGNPDARLRQFVAREYHRRGRHDEAVALAWSGFAEHPSLGGYQNLNEHAVLADDWPRWREKALGFLRNDLAQHRRDGARGWGWLPPDGSILVQIFLWEGDVEVAWCEAKENGCTTALWLDLARRREVDHPADALPIYQTQIEAAVAERNNRAYAEAAELVRRVRSALLRLGRPSDLTAYLEDLKARHRRMRNFLALLRDLEREHS